MNQNALYHQLIIGSMQRILKFIPKQLQSYKQLVEKSIEQIELAKDDRNRFDTNANKYFMIYKIGVDLKQARLTECCVNDLHALVSNGFMDGYSYDYIESGRSRGDRLLIDSMVELACQVGELNLIECLFNKCAVHGESMILCVTAVLNNEDALNRMINKVFSVPVQLTNEEKQLQQQRVNPLSLILSFPEIQQHHQMNVDDLIDRYMQITMVNLVDNVVIYLERADEDAPMNSVPAIPDDPRYRNLSDVKIINEANCLSGKFGWCIVCRESAPYFCKDTRVPICSIPCKKKHFEDSETIRLLMSPVKQQDLDVQDAKLLYYFIMKKAPHKLNQILRDHNNMIIKFDFTEGLFDMLVKDPQLTLTCIYYYRDILINQIEVAIEVHFIKQPQLQTLELIINYPLFILELFTNYDCTIGRKNVVQCIIESLASHGQNNKIQANILINLLLRKLQTQISHYESEIKQETSITILTKQIETFDNIEKQLNLKHQIQQAVLKFAISPKECWNYLILTNQVQEDNFDEYAQFLKDNQVNKDRLGEFFGESKEFNQKILFKYTNLLSFKNLSIVDALRKYLSLFTLPGEAQQVDRVMLVFSQKYFVDNDDYFKNDTETYVFSYLLIILQTDLHNKSVKQKMSLDQFSNSARVSLERELDREYLQQCYTSIQEQPLAIRIQGEQQIEMACKTMNHVYIFGPGIEYLKLLMDIIWPSLLVNYSITSKLDETNQHYSFQNCQITLQITTYLGLHEHNSQFIELLLKNQTKLYAKQCLIDLAVSNGNSLRGYWDIVLDIIHNDQNSLDKVIQNSKHMDSRTILDFLQAMIKLSRQYMNDGKVIMLQSLGEVTSFNMERIRLIWNQIWALLRVHFVEIGLCSDTEIALYGTDQLKQLSVKFLQIHEHQNQYFQKQFLEPFQEIYTQTESIQVKEYVMSCMRLLAHMCFYQLKSGWSILLSIVNQGLQEQISIANIAMEVLNKLFTEQNDLDLDDSLHLIFKRTEDGILVQGIEFLETATKTDYVFWVKSLAHLATLFNNLFLQSKVILAFFKILNKQLHQLKIEHLMKDLFKSLEFSNNKQLIQQSIAQFYDLIKVFTKEHANVIVYITSLQNETITKANLLLFKQLAIKQQEFDLVITTLGSIIDVTKPKQLINFTEQIQLNTEQVILQSILQLILIDMLEDIWELQLSLENRQKIIQLVFEQYKESFDFNRQFQIRSTLQKRGLMINLSNLPGLLKQEKQAAQLLFSLKYKLYNITQDEEVKISFLTNLFNLLEDKQIGTSEKERLMVNNMGILTQIIPLINQLSLDSQQNKRLLQSLITLPPCYSFLSQQCPHCQKCPHTCAQKQDYRKLQDAIQSLQLKIINLL